MSDAGDAPIQLLVDSPGGELALGLGLLDTMAYVPCVVATHVMGQASGTAALIVAAGTPGHRSAVPSASFVLRPGISTSGLALTDMARAGITRMTDLADRILLEHTRVIECHLDD